jgi:5-methylcytosine-specific restriction endonuclease McrA
MTKNDCWKIYQLIPVGEWFCYDHFTEIGFQRSTAERRFRDIRNDGRLSWETSIINSTHYFRITSLDPVGRIVPSRKAITKSQAKRIYERDDGYCQLYCKRWIPFDEAEYDHKEPHQVGGETVDENLQTSCKSCNLQKSSHCRSCVLSTCDGCKIKTGDDCLPIEWQIAISDSAKIFDMTITQFCKTYLTPILQTKRTIPLNVVKDCATDVGISDT